MASRGRSRVDAAHAVHHLLVGADAAVLALVVATPRLGGTPMVSTMPPRGQRRPGKSGIGREGGRGRPEGSAAWARSPLQLRHPAALRGELQVQVALLLLQLGDAAVQPERRRRRPRLHLLQQLLRLLLSTRTLPLSRWGPRKGPRPGDGLQRHQCPAAHSFAAGSMGGGSGVGWLDPGAPGCFG